MPLAHKSRTRWSLRGNSRPVRFAVAVLATASLAATFASTAGAHAWLVRSVPVYGTSVHNPPPTVRLEFSERVSRALTKVTMVGAHSGAIQLLDITNVGARGLLVRVPKLKADLYRLEWRTVSDGDLHASSGRLVFGVDTALPRSPTGAPQAGPPGTAWGEVFLRWDDFVAIAALIGALVMLLHIVPKAARRGARGLEVASASLIWLGFAGCIFALLSGGGLLLAQMDRSGASIGRILTETRYGHAWLGREAILVVLACILMALRRSPSNRALRLSAAILGLGIVAPLSLVSHAASARGDFSAATCALAIHLLAAAVWVGGVAALCLASFELMRAGERAAARTLAHCFGSTAALGVALIAITGVAMLGVHVRSLDTLLSTTYGAALITKTGLFLLAGALGLATTAGLRMRRSPTWLMSAWLRAPRLEGALLVAILLPAAYLVASAPPRDSVAQLAENQPTAQARTATPVGDLILDLSVEPNKPGRNFVTVGVYNVRRPALAPVESVELSVAQAGASARLTALTRAGQRWQGTIDTITPGNLLLGLVVKRPGLRDVRYTTSWPVSSASRPASERWLQRPLQPILEPAAIGGAALLLLVLLARLCRGLSSPVRRSVPTRPGRGELQPKRVDR